jgi:hypothetical protein
MKKHRKKVEYHQCLQKHSMSKKQTQSQSLVSKLIKETQTKSQWDKITYKITKHNERRNKSRKNSPYAHVDIWIDKITIFVLTKKKRKKSSKEILLSMCKTSNAFKNKNLW